MFAFLVPTKLGARAELRWTAIGRAPEKRRIGAYLYSRIAAALRSCNGDGSLASFFVAVGVEIPDDACFFILQMLRGFSHGTEFQYQFCLIRYRCLDS